MTLMVSLTTVPEDNVGDVRNVLSSILSLHPVWLWTDPKLSLATLTVGSQVPLHCIYNLHHSYYEQTYSHFWEHVVGARLRAHWHDHLCACLQQSGTTSTGGVAEGLGLTWKSQPLSPRLEVASSDMFRHGVLPLEL